MPLSSAWQHAERQRETRVSAETVYVFPELRCRKSGDQRPDVNGRDVSVEKRGQLVLLLGQLELIAAERADARFDPARSDRNKQ